MFFSCRTGIGRLLLSGVISLSAASSLHAAESNCGAYYEVQPNDSLGAIASRFYGRSGKYTLIHAANANALKNGPSSIRVGQKLLIPCDDGTAPLQQQASEAEPPKMNPSEALFYAARDAHLKEVVALVQQGANVNYMNRSRETPMHAAASVGRVDILHYLHNRGASHTLATKNGWLPLHHAVRFGHVEAAQYLIRIGSPINAMTEDRKTIFDMAYGIRSGAMVNLLNRYSR